MNKYTNKLGTPSGFRDLLPIDAGRREYIISIITNIYKKFGFLPLETPIAEFENILISESNVDFNLFRLESTRERQGEGDKEETALRFDLTVPLARVVSQYGNNLPRPFKRYQSGYVFRGERPQKGRYRQFMQFDADIVGTKNPIADAEMIAMIVGILRGLSVEDFVVRVNTRTLLNTLPQFASFAENLLREVLVILDKAEKISDEELVSSLQKLRITEAGIKKIQAFSKISGSPRKVISELKNFFDGFEEALTPIQELEQLAQYLEVFGIVDKVSFDMKIIRGFAYYTGIVFETNLLNAPDFGSVISGGRYDNLVERFMSQSIPAVGVSVGVDRLESALASLNISFENSNNSKVVIFSQSSSCDEYALLVSSRIRLLGFVVDMYVGNKKDIREMFEYAESVEGQYAVIIGTQEVADKQISIKHLASRSQIKQDLGSLSAESFTFNS